MLHSYTIMKSFQCFWILLSFAARHTHGALKEPMSAWREAKAQLRTDVLSHKALQAKLCPAEQNSTVKMSFFFYTYAVLAGDEVEQSFTSVNYFEVHWNDTDLTWNPEDYNGVNITNIPYNEIWHPHLLVTNSADPDLMMVTPMNNHLLVHCDGSIMLHTPAFLKTTCSLDLTHYPFDKQECEIIFLAFFEDCDFEITRAYTKKMPDPFQLRGEWSIVSRDFSTSYFGDGSLHLPLVKVKLTLTRSSLFYVVSILAPMMLTSVMTSFVFCIPPESGEKVSFLVTVFVSNAVFLNFIAGTMPRSMTVSNMPRLTMFLIGVMVESFFALLATLFVMRKFNAEQKARVPTNQKRDEDAKHYTGLYSLNLVSNNESKLDDDKRSDVETKEPEISAGKTRFLGFFSKKYAAKVEPKCQHMKGHPKKQNIERRSRCLMSREWDVLFFILFHLTCAPFYFLLFAP